MDTFLQDLRIALRSLGRRPAFTLGAVLTLALGIGAATSIFSVVNGVLLRPLPYPESERIVRIWWHDVSEPAVASAAGATSPSSLADWQERTRSFEAIAQYTRSSVSVMLGGEAELIPGGTVTADFFRVLGLEPVIGRSFTADETTEGGPRAAVISHGLWQARFGGRPDVLGESIALASGSSWTIVGVAPPGADFPAGAEVWLPLRPTAGCGRDCVYLTALARLAPGVSVDQARAELRAVAADLAELFPEAHRESTLAAAPLHEVAVSDVRNALWILLGAVMLVVLIACANVANLLLVRNAGRTGELAVRAALGAGRARLVRQLLTESLALALLGGVAGVLLAFWGVALLPLLASESLPRVAEIGLNAGSIGFTLALVGVTALVFGVAPALHLSRASLAGAIRASERTGAAPLRRFGRFALLTTEVALSLALLLGAGLLLRSFQRLQDAPLGYEPDGVATFFVSLPESRYPEPSDAVRFFDDMKARLAALPGVQAASYALGTPFDPNTLVGSFRRMDLPEPEPGTAPGILLRFVDTEYLATLGITLVRGRGFEAADRYGAQPVALISRAAAAQHWPGEDPIGRQVQLGLSLSSWGEAAPRTIVGIVDDVRSVQVTDAGIPEMYIPSAQTGAAGGTFVIRTAGATGAVLAAAREALRGRDPLLPMARPGTLRESVDRQLAAANFYRVLLSLFAGLAVALAAVGVYSVVAFIVVRRTREIGVRIALGARPASVVRGVVAQGLGPALAGVLLGGAAAAAGTRVLESLLYETTPHDPGVYAAAAGTLVLIVVAACALPARRAAAIPPSVALRQD